MTNLFFNRATGMLVRGGLVRLGGLACLLGQSYRVSFAVFI